MHHTQNLKIGYVYYLKDYTAPKIFNGLYFECLLSLQKIPAHAEVKQEICEYREYEGDVWNAYRFYHPKPKHT